MDPTLQNGQTPGSTTIHVTQQNASVRTGAPVSQGPRTVTTKGGINWGGVVKGALTIGAVILVGVAAFSLVSWGVGAFLASNATAAGVAASSTTTMGGALTTISQGASFLFQSAQVFFTNLAGGAVASAPVLATQAAPLTHAIAGGSGLVAAGIAAPVAIKSIMSTPLVNPDVTSVVTPDPHSAMADSGNAATVMSAKKGVMASQAVDMHADAHAGHASEVAAKAAHHVSEDQHERQQHLAQQMLAQQAANRSWAERVGGPSAAPSQIKPRNASFAAQYDAENVAAEQGLNNLRG